MGFRAINEDGSGLERSAGETQEAKESRIIQLYEKALLHIAQGRDSASLVSRVLQQALSKSEYCCYCLLT